MAYYFRVISDEVEDFFRDIEINEDVSFADFSQAILLSVDFDVSPMNSFTICDTHWNKEDEILPQEFAGKNTYTLEKTLLKKVLSEKGQKLLFTFDPLNNRTFFIELMEIEKGVVLKTPMCTQEEGNPPNQYQANGKGVETEDPFLDDDMFSEELDEEDIDGEEFYGF